MKVNDLIKEASVNAKTTIFFNSLFKLLLRTFIFVIALFFTALFSILGVIFSIFYYILSFKWVTGMYNLSEYIYQIALSIDQLGNVTCQNVFNYTMVNRKLKYHPFGDEDDTISYCLAMNQKKKTLSKFGKFWVWFLDTVDSSGGGHMYKTLLMKDKRDLEACDRINK